MSAVQISLKKASEYARLAIEAANKMAVPTQISLSVFSTATPHEAVAAARAKAEEALADAGDLYLAGFSLRQEIGRANAASGVSDHLAAIAADEAVIKKLQALVGGFGDDAAEMLGIPRGEADLDLDAEARRMAALRAAHEAGATPGRGYSRLEDSLSLPVVNSAMRERLKADIAQMRRFISTRKDAVAALNFTVKVDLDETHAAVLRRHGIAD